jgi:hypothetical protein
LPRAAIEGGAPRVVDLGGRFLLAAPVANEIAAIEFEPPLAVMDPIASDIACAIVDADVHKWIAPVDVIRYLRAACTVGHH